MPVTTWSMNARNVALPKTYHQPVRRGTGCSNTPRNQLSSPVRSSKAARRCLITPRSPERDLSRQNLHLPVSHPRPIAGEGFGRRAARDAAVGVVHAAVARTEEELGVGEPPHRAAEVSAVDRERGEAARVVSPEPRGAAGAHPGPGKRRGVLELHG